MWHQTDHVALAVADPGYGMKRAIWIGIAVVFSGIMPVRRHVVENNLVVAFEFCKHSRLAEIIPLVMRNRHFQNLSALCGTSERRVGGFNADMNLAAKIPQPFIPHHR